MRRATIGHHLASISLILLAAKGTLFADENSVPFPVFPISTTTNVESFPRIDGRYVVWADLGGPPGSTNDAYAYDLVSGQRITVADGSRNQDDVSIGGSVAIWSDTTPGSPALTNIYGRDLSGGGGSFTVTAAAGAQSAHNISGNLVVWHDKRNGTTQIWGRKLDQPVGSDFAISSIDAAFEQIFPDVSGNIAVWMSFQEPGDQGNIYGRDVTTGGVFPVTTNAANQLYPRISGRVVVWTDTRDGEKRIYGRNLDSGTDFPISSGVAEQISPAIDGDLVVWRDSRAGVPDIWGRHLSGGPEFQITNTPDLWESYPDVSGNTVVWEQTIGSSYVPDIYGTVVPEPTMGTVILFAALAPVLQRRKTGHLWSNRSRSCANSQPQLHFSARTVTVFRNMADNQPIKTG